MTTYKILGDLQKSLLFRHHFEGPHPEGSAAAIAEQDSLLAAHKALRADSISEDELTCVTKALLDCLLLRKEASGPLKEGTPHANREQSCLDALLSEPETFSGPTLR